MWKEYIKKTLISLKENGLISTGKMIGSKVTPFSYRKIFMYHKDLAALESKDEKYVELCVASEQDVNESYKDVWNTKSKAIEKLKDGHLLFLIKKEGKNVLYGWVELRKINIPWIRIKNMSIPPDVGYLANVYTPPAFQGRLIGLRFLKSYEKYLLSHTSIRRIFCITVANNRGSNGNLIHAGYTVYQKVNFIKILFLKIYIATSIDETKSENRKIFISNTKFWNYFSPILKNE
jgi:hypothetical protein